MIYPAQKQLFHDLTRYSLPENINRHHILFLSGNLETPVRSTHAMAQPHYDIQNAKLLDFYIDNDV